VAHGAFFMLGAVLAWWCAQAIGGPPAAGFAVSLLVAPLGVAAIATVIDRLILSRVGYDPDATIVATIGLVYVLEQATLMAFGPEARSIEPPFYVRVVFPWFGYSGYKLAAAAAAILLLVAVWFVLTRTRLGLVMRATQYDRETAQNFGIPVERVYTAVFAVGAALAAVAGVLVLPIQQAHYLMGQDPLLLSFIVVTLGGLGSLRGTLFAALLIGLSDGVVSVFFSPTVAKILATLLVALVLVYRPAGLFAARRT
jgi:branched-chain amino acid transport system permease protein